MSPVVPAGNNAERSDDGAVLVTGAATMQSEAMRRSGARD
ncbi:hypothetical protein K875_04276 [Mycobacterium [tuberculosis] TKK-01-0051]|uniref:Uncharacterized protein n=1 Tax=Mycobacterium [tuberculosis] TKK-01-0051 TaxID=1324261 RepID=A0A051TWX1_9MYCO|nr:hypothetical protein K875_04276 [Mycobacterium [tuberculosis] TKK-01-0051]